VSANPKVPSTPAFRADEVLASAGILLRSTNFPLILRPSRPFDNDELLEFCAANDSLRIERNPAGELIVMTPAGGKTGNREGFLFRELDFWVEQQQRGIAFNSNTGFSLPDGSVRAPDAAWLSSDKWNSLTSEQQSRFLPFCPEFVIELRPPSDSLTEIETKMSDWMANGAHLGWLIDPQRRLAMIYRPNQEPATLLQPEFVHGEGPIAGFSLKMLRFWE
jgi:Uma2 family endonuclease